MLTMSYEAFTFCIQKVRLVVLSIFGTGFIENEIDYAELQWVCVSVCVLVRACVCMCVFEVQCVCVCVCCLSARQ